MLEYMKRQIKIVFLSKNAVKSPYIYHRRLLFDSS